MTEEIEHGSTVSSELTENAALALLESRDLSAEAIEVLSKNNALTKSRKVLVAIARHIHTPRHVSIPIVRQLFVFELMQLALLPAIAADIKLLAEELLVAKLGSTTVGERLSLARRSSTRVAAALLTDADGRVRDAALNNPYMTAMYVVRAMMKPGCPPALIRQVRQHGKWCCRIEVKKALEAMSNVSR